MVALAGNAKQLAPALLHQRHADPHVAAALHRIGRGLADLHLAIESARAALTPAMLAAISTK